MKDTYHADYVATPRSIVNYVKRPKQTLVSLKLNDILHALGEVGLLECPGGYITKLLPSMAKADRRQKALLLLSELKLVPLRDGQPIKVYDFINYANGKYCWQFTAAYIRFFGDAGIWLPNDAAEGLKNYMEFYGND